MLSRPLKWGGRSAATLLPLALLACGEPEPPEPPPEMVEVPGGPTIIGCAAGCGIGTIPQQVVGIGRFEIDRLEVTVGDWGGCVAVGVCEPIACTFRSGSPNEPMGCVTQQQAEAFCNWKGKRLPMELEWEKAARGPDGQRYPWGDTPPGPLCSIANYDCGDVPIDVGSFPDGASPYGALDMLGNVAEFTIPWDVVTNPDNDEVWRGGDSTGNTFVGDVEAQSSSRWTFGILGTWNPTTGFRCVR